MKGASTCAACKGRSVVFDIVGEAWQPCPCVDYVAKQRRLKRTAKGGNAARRARRGAR
jgi:hypothetical protein